MNEISNVLKSFKIEGHTYSDMYKELCAVLNNSSVLGRASSLTPKAATFGLYFIEEVSNPSNVIYRPKVFSIYKEDFIAMTALGTSTMWSDKEYCELLIYFFGEEMTPLILQLLEQVDDYVLGEKCTSRYSTWKTKEMTFLKQCNSRIIRFLLLW